MKSIFILLLITNGCLSTKTEVKGYATESQCLLAQKEAVENGNSFFNNTRAYCSSAGAILEKTQQEK